MKTKKQQIWKSISLLVFAFATSLFLFTNCSDDDDDFTEPQLTISDEGQIAFEKDAGSKTIDIKTNREWKVTIEDDADWIDVTPTSGLEGTATLTVTVKSNDGGAREGFFTIIASTERKTVTVTQAGEDGSVIEYNTIEEIRAMYADKGQDEWTIAEPLKLKAVVISDRVGGNSPSLRNGFIQDESGKGLAFRVTESIHEFNMGDEVNINLEGAVVSEYAGAVQLGFSTTAAKVQAKDVGVTPKELTIEEILDGAYDATLVKIKDVQFKDYKNLNYYEGEENATNRTLENCNNANIIARTTKYAKFKDEALPRGNGHIVGIMSVFNGTWQLTIRNLNDVSEMSNDESTRCTPDVPPITGTKISVADFRAALVEGETYTEDNYLEGEVILNPSEKNTPDFVVYLADETAGIALTLSDKENILTKMPLGAKIKVNVKDTKHTVYNGLIQIGASNSLSTEKVEMVEETPSTPLQPKVVTLQDILDGKNQSDLVKVNNVQFKEVPAKYKGTQTLTNEESKEVAVYTRDDATFADENVKEGMGSFIGVVSIFNNPQLLIRSLDDLADMTGERFVVPSIETDVNVITFEKEGGDKTITITANVDWTVSSDETWLTITPTSGSNDGVITASATANAAEERTATITITDGTTTKTIAVAQVGAETIPTDKLLFPGSDFNNWTTFTSALSSYGITFGKESATEGRDGSGAMLLEGQHAKNDYVFTAVVPDGFSAAGKTKINFWIKGTSAKSLSMNVYVGTGNTMGTDYKCYNMDDYVPYNSHQVLDPTDSNSYAKGGIDTNGEWIQVTLDISTIANNINSTQGDNLFALKVGKTAAYDLLIDDITIE